MFQNDLDASLTEAIKFGVDGVILWDDHHMEDNSTVCSRLQEYISNTLGPLCQKLINLNINYNPATNQVHFFKHREAMKSDDRFAFSYGSDGFIKLDNVHSGHKTKSSNLMKRMTQS